MKFIHTADLHLGYKFSSSYSPDTLKVLKDNQKKVLSNIIDLGNQKEIDALLISGDLFDTPKVSKELVSFVKEEFERATFNIFIICGNHDPKIVDGIFNTETFSENVYIFPEGMSVKKFDDFDICGISFSGPHKLDNSLKDYKIENKDKLNIILSHGDLIKESYYNPMTLSDIKSSGADYVALGHIHAECDINNEGGTYYGYSGTPQALTFNETEETYVILGEIKKGFLKYEKIKVCEHNFKEITIKADLITSLEQIVSLIKNEISNFNISKTLFKIKFIGYIEDNLLLDEEYIINELIKDLLYIKIDFNLTKKYNIELIKNEQSVRGEFVRNALEHLCDKDEDYILKVIEYGVSRL